MVYQHTALCVYRTSLCPSVFSSTNSLQTVQELCQIMEEVGTLKAEREVIEQQLKGPVADISELYCIIINKCWVYVN